MPYYNRFVSSFPKVEDLAKATEDQVLKLWEGLGYYSRARNLHATAKVIANDLNGVFPNTHAGLLALKGIGPYTAAAIGSICFSLKTAAVDGNVNRVLARYFGIRDSIDETATKKSIADLANEIIEAADPGGHNQAMMELGATICTPKQPKCELCPLADSCIALKDQIQKELPVRSKKTRVRDRFFYYKVTMVNGDTYIQRRVAGDIWQGLYEFPMLEAEKRLNEAQILKGLSINAKDEVISISDEFKHILSHQRLMARFVKVRTDPPKNCNFIKVAVDNLSSFAFPRLINRYLEKQNLVIDKEV